MKKCAEILIQRDPVSMRSKRPIRMYLISFLQVLDDGHITDAQGRKIDFKNTIIIMTSNAGAENIIAPETSWLRSCHMTQRQIMNS